MKIDRKNYEAYFLDYLEGNLDEDMVNDFIEFLGENPGLKEELSDLELLTIGSEPILFNKKENLHKVKLDIENEFNKAAIAKIEGDIYAAENLEFEKYIEKNPGKKRDVVLFGQTKLKADETVTFSKKKKLYRYPVQRTVILWTARVAAVLVLAFAFFMLTDKPATDIATNNRVAKFDEKTVGAEKTVTLPELKETAVKNREEEAAKTDQTKAKVPIKEVLAGPGQNGSIGEKSKVILEHETLALNRDPNGIPAKIISIPGSISVRRPKTRLAVMHLSIPENSYGDERLLADVIKEKTGLDKLRFDKITKAGLKLVSNISNDKFNFETNKDGKVVKYNYDSRILAFSIPTKNEAAE